MLIIRIYIRATMCDIVHSFLDRHLINSSKKFNALLSKLKIFQLKHFSSRKMFWLIQIYFAFGYKIIYLTAVLHLLQVYPTHNIHLDKKSNIPMYEVPHTNEQVIDSDQRIDHLQPSACFMLTRLPVLPLTAKTLIRFFRSIINIEPLTTFLSII